MTSSAVVARTTARRFPAVPALVVATTAGVATVCVLARGAVSHAWADVAGVARVPSTVVLLMCAALIATHYLLLAAGVRFLATVPLPWPEVLGVQMTAAVAGRFTPAGVGPAALNGRYLMRRGMSGPAVLAMLGTMNILGALSDLVGFTAFLVIGSALGWSGIDSATDRSRSAAASAITRFAGSPVAWIVVAALLTVIVLVMRTHRPRISHLAGCARHVVAIGVAQARERPGAMVRFGVASAGTTACFGAAFALIVADAAPGAQNIAALFVGYFVASAAANAIPVPGGIGSTDALLVAAAVAAGTPAAAATASILVFRVMTFWAPVPIGLGTGVWLRRRSCL